MLFTNIKFNSFPFRKAGCLSYGVLRSLKDAQFETSRLFQSGDIVKNVRGVQTYLKIWSVILIFEGDFDIFAFHVFLNNF